METKKNKFLSYLETSKLLGVPLGTLYSLVHAKKIPHYRYGRRFVRFSQLEILDWVADHKIKIEKKL